VVPSLRYPIRDVMNGNDPVEHNDYDKKEQEQGEIVQEGIIHRHRLEDAPSSATRPFVRVDSFSDLPQSVETLIVESVDTHCRLLPGRAQEARRNRFAPGLANPSDTRRRYCAANGAPSSGTEMGQNSPVMDCLFSESTCRKIKKHLGVTPSPVVLLRLATAGATSPARSWHCRVGRCARNTPYPWPRACPSPHRR
jgi:hypothetical protein